MIKFEQIVENKEYKERVIKFFRLPLRLSLSLEKFNDYMSFLEKTNNSFYTSIIESVEHDFNYEVERQGTTEPDFTMEYVIEPVIEKIAETTEWKEFAEKDYSETLGDFSGITNPNQFYKKENDGKYFLSVDLKQANWQSLQKVTGIKEDYEDFIVKYTDNKIPPLSKVFRTKVTSLLNAKKIMEYNKHLLNENKESIIEVVSKLTGVNLGEKEIFAFYADEFLIELSKEEVESMTGLNLIEDEVFLKVGVKVHLTAFQLKWLGLNKSCMKVYKDSAEILNISKEIKVMIEKIVNDISISDIDFEGVKVKGNKDVFLEDIHRIAAEYKEMNT